MTVAPRPLCGIHQRLTLPPPPRRAPLAVFFRLKVDDDLAWALFLVARHIRDLAEFPPEGIGEWMHGKEIRAIAARATEIAQPLSFLADACWVDGETRKDHARACHRISQWAGEQGFGELAVQFGEAAVALLPNSARANYEAGRMNRLFGNTGEAAVFYSRAICLARKKRWSVYVRAHLGIGQLCEARGQRDRAAAHYKTASQAAWSASGERWLAALTQHDLLVLRADDGDFEAAFEHARRAYRWMPKHHASVPTLAHDYCLVLLHHHAYNLALSLLDAAVQKEFPSVHKVLVWSTLARTAGLLGITDRFRKAAEHVELLLRSYDHHAAAAHMNLGIGAHALGLFDEAEQHVERSIRLSHAQVRPSLLTYTEPLLAAVRRKERPEFPSQTQTPLHLSKLAKDLASRLSQWRGPTWKLKTQSDKRRLGRV